MRVSQCVPKHLKRTSSRTSHPAKPSALERVEEPDRGLTEADQPCAPSSSDAIVST